MARKKKRGPTMYRTKSAASKGGHKVKRVVRYKRGAKKKVTRRRVRRKRR